MKMPALKEKIDGMEKLGLGYDPKEFPGPLQVKDPALKEFLRHRDDPGHWLDHAEKYDDASARFYDEFKKHSD